MAGNFWQSSHYQQWILDPDDLLRERHEDLSVLTPEEYQKIIIFFANFIQALGEHPSIKVRQQVIATATIYFKRFYARNSLRSIDPLLMAPTCIFLASKVEEFGMISNTRLVSTCQQVVKTKFAYAYSQEFPYRINHILECEFFLLEAMDCCLILFHPYRSLLQYVQDMNGDDSLLQLAWRIINDSLRTDVSLLYPPFMISLAALHLACVIQQKDVKQWFAELSVDFEKVIEISRHILALYELWKSYDEKKEISTILNNKMPKPKLSPSRPPSQGPNGQQQEGSSVSTAAAGVGQQQNTVVQQTGHQQGQ
jgi:cyclin C